MANNIPFGNSFVDFYPKYTQFILEYLNNQTTVLDAENNNFLQYAIRHPKNLSVKYNKHKASSFVLSTDINSFNDECTDFLNMLLELFTTGPTKNDMKNLLLEYDIDFLGIIELSPQTSGGR